MRGHPAGCALRTRPRPRYRRSAFLDVDGYTYRNRMLTNHCSWHNLTTACCGSRLWNCACCRDASQSRCRCCPCNHTNTEPAKAPSACYTRPKAPSACHAKPKTRTAAKTFTRNGVRMRACTYLVFNLLIDGNYLTSLFLGLTHHHTQQCQIALEPSVPRCLLTRREFTCSAS